MNLLQQLNQLLENIHHHQVQLCLLLQEKRMVDNLKYVKVQVVMVVNVHQQKPKLQHQCLVKNRQIKLNEKVVHQQQDRKHQMLHRHRQLYKDDQVIVVQRKHHVIVNEVFQVVVTKMKLKMKKMRIKMMLILLKRYFILKKTFEKLFLFGFFHLFFTGQYAR